MRAVLSWMFLALSLALLGAQIMVALEAQIFPLLTLGQSAALAYWPDPAGATQRIDALIADSGFAARALSLPALPIFIGLWLLSWTKKR
ncbi:MAG: hypothetical protein AAF337_11895 [Pseudomonadota bacterium]